jgi:predicted amidohydrolase YtcJ
MKNLNIHLSFGSDAPVESPNPLKGIYCAVNRKDLKNRPSKVYLPQESISVYEGLYHYTVEGAYASNDAKKGTLNPGYVADLVVVSGPIFENPLDACVDMTIVNGEIVYKK